MRKFLLPLVAAAGLAAAGANIAQAVALPIGADYAPPPAAGFAGPAVQNVYYGEPGGWRDHRWAEHERWVRWHRWHEWHHWHHYGAGYGY